MHVHAHRAASPVGAAMAANLRYDRVVRRLLALFGAGKDRTASALWASLDAACAELAAEGVTSQDEVRMLHDCIARDISHIAYVLVRGMSDDSAAVVRLAEDRGALRAMLEALRLSGDAIYRMAGATRGVQLRHAGEATCAGTLRCVGCGKTQRATQALVAAPCPACAGTEFEKSLHP